MLPAKLQTGQTFKPSVVRTINNIIDYLKTQRLVGDNRTIRINQLSAGVALSVIEKSGGRSGGGGDPFDHPFKLKVTADESGKQQLGMTFGCIYFQSNFSLGQFYGVGFEKIEGIEGLPEYIPFDWESVEDGSYGVSVVVYDTATEEGEYKNVAAFITRASEVEVPYCPGFYSICIGTIRKTTIESEEGETSYSLELEAQGVVGDLVISSEHTEQPFAIKFFVDFDPEDGELKDGASFTLAHVFVNNGMVYTSDECFSLKDETGLSLPEPGAYICYIEGGEIKWGEYSLLETMELSSNCFLVCAFQLTEGNCIYYQQFIKGDILLGGNSDFSHPFKLYVETDEEGNPGLFMQAGDVRLQKEETAIIRFNHDFGVDWGSVPDGVYGVCGAVASSMDDSIQPKVFLIQESLTTHDIPSCSGFFSFPIGSIVVQTIETPEGDFKTAISILEQYQYSDLVIDCRYTDLPFTAKVCYDVGDENEIKSSKDDFSVVGAKVSTGAVYDKTVDYTEFQSEMYQIIEDEGTEPGSGTTYCWLQGTLEKETNLIVWEIKWGAEIEPYFETEGQTILTQKYALAMVEVGEQGTRIFDFHPSDFIFEKPDTYKVKCNGFDSHGAEGQDDPEPGFLIDKLMGSRRSLDILQDCWNDHFGEGHAAPGYIYMELDCRPKTSSEIRFYWDFISMPGWCEDYLTLNCKEGFPIWEAQGMVRMTAEDENAGFLPEKITAKEPIKVEVKDEKLQFSVDMSKFTGSIKAGEGSCFTIEDKSTNLVENGKEYQITLDEQCLFNKLKLTGEAPIVVTGGGKEWKISFDDDDFLKEISVGDCLKVEKNGSTANIELDLDCILENLEFEIVGTEPISVTQQGKKYTISIDESKLGGSIEAGECITVQDGENGKIVSVDKDCIFSDFSITSSEPLVVEGQGQNWEISLSEDFKTSIGKVKVSAEDDLGYLSEKFENNTIIDFDSYGGKKIEAKFGENAVVSNDDSIIIDLSYGFADIKAKGQVRCSETDSLTYLPEKLKSSDGSVIITPSSSDVDFKVIETKIQSPDQSLLIEEPSEGADPNIWELEINPDFFHSSDQSIIISDLDESGKLDFQSAGKVKVQEDDSNGFLAEKIEIDSSLSGLVKMENTGTKLVLKSAIEGSGIMVVNNGSISILQAPSGNAVLVAENGTLTWKEFAPCETACN